MTVILFSGIKRVSIYYFHPFLLLFPMQQLPKCKFLSGAKYMLQIRVVYEIAIISFLSFAFFFSTCTMPSIFARCVCLIEELHLRGTNAMRAVNANDAVYR